MEGGISLISFCSAASRFSSLLPRITVVPEVNGNSTRVWGKEQGLGGAVIL